MERTDEGVLRAVRRLLGDATEFTENERAERNVESAIELLEALETGEGVAPAERNAPAASAPGEE